jgi:hypothetical protein
LWNEDYETRQRKMSDDDRRKAVLSTKFSLHEDSQSTVTEFTRLLNDHPYFQEGNFDIYSPNAYMKGTCDPQWTRMEWACRGSYETCKKEPGLKTGRPHAACCWRYSFRWHLEQTKEMHGFMIQVVDIEQVRKVDRGKNYEYVLGDGQKIETVMAKEVGTKVFRIYRPRALDRENRRQLFQPFRDKHIDILVKHVEGWYQSSCSDMYEHEIRIDEEW